MTLAELLKLLREKLKKRNITRLKDKVEIKLIKKSPEPRGVQDKEEKDEDI